MLHDSTSDAGDHPVLTLKAWNSRVWLAYMDHCMGQQHETNLAAGIQDREMLLAVAATRNLLLWFCEQEAANQLYLTESEAETIYKHAMEYLKYAQALAQHASDAGVLRWKILPKHHDPRSLKLSFKILHFKSNSKFESLDHHEHAQQ